jgi:hypothetical protein
MENGFLLVELGRRGININDRASLAGLRCTSSAAAAIVSPGTRDTVLQGTSGAGATASCWKWVTLLLVYGFYISTGGAVQYCILRIFGALD